MSRAGARATIGAVLALGLLLLGGLTLPEPARDLGAGRLTSDDPLPPVVAGAFHVHSNRSDGADSLEAIAAAAARTGLSFVVVTDHGDGTRAPEPPRYHANVLILDGLEVTTTDGHYLSVGHLQAPYPLGGEARDVAADIERLGGFGVAAHPASPKPALAWTDWSTAVGGIEWLNADSAWRDESWLRLGLAVLHYPIRPAQAIAALFDRPTETLWRWDTMTQARSVVALAGADAHGAAAVPGVADVRLRPIPIPSYEEVFRTFAIRVQLDEVWSGDAAADAAALLEGLREGRVYTAIDALAPPGRFHFAARSGGDVVQAGGSLGADLAVELTVRADLPPGGEIHLLENGAMVQRSNRPELRYVTTAGRAVYRVEVALVESPGRPAIPWIVSNAIRVGFDGPPGPRHQDATGNSVVVFTDEPDVAGWTVEHDAESLAAVDSTEAVEGRELALRYALSDGQGAGPFAALVHERIGEAGEFDRIRFRVRSDAPGRVSVQLRAGGGEEDVRWRRSVYADTTTREVTVRLQEMRPATSGGIGPPVVDAESSLLFVVDTVNTPPITSGVVWLDDLRLERR
ncbi:MAG: hypothetical protein QGG24_05740 [Vicinamibacterales bacterium]|jgi:hypothetical protein|nr:hypothetical protein [Acidobacteriota bacterium]MDP7294807.1 hypothetical protein [Vicinamibacterales bacterium]MDP7471079.1 hypothetical protein [Vicinamibacterales bacterium]MDP7672234.1 hypothetical protein [Vicinamibacterales bacterium]HJO37655.1 hypothetical protein [Vicinamibacterales bacterium]